MNELASTLGRLWTSIDDLNRDIPAELDAVPDAQSALILLGLLRSARKDLQQVEAFVEHACAGRMDGKDFQAPGVTAVRRQTAEKTVWLHEDLATAVAVSAMVDGNGELPSEEAQIVGSAVKAKLVECGAFSYWRVGKLKAAGIDVGRSYGSAIKAEIALANAGMST
jgi:hypothetical protein